MNSVNHIFSQGVTILNGWSDRVSERVVLPVIYHSYQFTGQILARTAGIFSRKCQETISEFWVDPLSSRHLLSILRPIEHFSLFISQKPKTKIRLFHFIDQSMISHAQNIYIYIKEVNNLLYMPQQIRMLVKRYDFLGTTYHFLKKVSLNLLSFVLKIIDLAFQCLIANPDVMLLGYARTIIHHAAKQTNKSLSEVANMAIEKREAKIRKKIVARAANHIFLLVTTYANRILSKTGIGLGLYRAADWLWKANMTLSPTYLQIAASALTVSLIWNRTVYPYLEEYYYDYRSNFNPNKSYLRHLLSRYNLKHFHFPLEGAHRLLKRIA